MEGPATFDERGAGARLWRRRLGRALRLGLRLALAFAGFSVAWVAMYGLVNPPTTILIEAERWRLGSVEQFWRPLDAFPEHAALTMMAAEDANFCAHLGVDFAALGKAFGEWRRGEELRGASTITQQTAKNVFLWPGRNFLRKGLELWFAGLMELLWSKRRIMEVYLNVAEFGEGAFGLEAGARRAFGRGVTRLTRRQAALLAAALPAPRSRDAGAPGGFLSRRADAIADGALLLAKDGRGACLTP